MERKEILVTPIAYYNQLRSKIYKGTYPLRSFPNDVMSEEANNNQTRGADKQRKAHDSGSKTSDIEHINFFESSNTVKIDEQIESYFVLRF